MTKQPDPKDVALVQGEYDAICDLNRNSPALTKGELVKERAHEARDRTLTGGTTPSP